MIYRNVGPPRLPLSFAFGCLTISTFGQKLPFTKFASKDHYTFYFPPLGTEAWRRAIRSSILRDLHLPFGPIAATVAVTGRCPCSCYHCSADRRSRDGEMSTSELKEVIRQCVDLKTCSVVLTGGEPMARDDLPALSRHVLECGAIPQMFTSGYYLERERVRELKEGGMKVIFVSLDSPDAEEHDSGRGVPGLFDRACSGIRMAAEEGISTGISTFATHEAVARRYPERFLDLGERLGVNEVTVFDVTPTGRMIDDEDLLLTPEERRALSDLEEGQYARKTGPKIVTMSYVNNPGIVGCFGAKWQIHVTHDGFVTPCDFTPLHFGNVREEPLSAIWNRMRAHPEYRKKTVGCRMQDMEFRRKFISKIPSDAPLPYPIDHIPIEE